MDDPKKKNRFQLGHFLITLLYLAEFRRRLQEHYNCDRVTLGLQTTNLKLLWQTKILLQSFPPLHLYLNGELAQLARASRW